MNSRPARSRDHHTAIGKGLSGATSRNETNSAPGTTSGRLTANVYAVRYTIVRSRLRTRTTSCAPSGLANSKMYVPDPSVTPGSPTGRVNVRYSVWRASTVACIDAVVVRPRAVAAKTITRNL